VTTAACGPRFGLLVRGELRKLARQRLNWLLVALALVFGSVAGLVLSTSSGVWHAEHAYRQSLQTDPTYWVHGIVVVAGMIVRIVEGALLLFAAARLVGMEYSAGTIRVVLARGVGRVRLLTAKLAALAAFAVGVTAVFILLVAVWGLVMVVVQGGSVAKVLPVLGGSELPDVGVHLLTVLVSAAVCVLIGAAGAAVGRSLAFAMLVAVGFFPLDNFVAGGRPYNVYQLGTNLNGLNETLGHLRESIFSRPAAPVDATHSLAVIGVWCAVFLVAAYLPTWRRDVLE
jgi:ABC-type transport system involved in multi-copper enzyme maturation permease subunit